MIKFTTNPPQSVTTAQNVIAYFVRKSAKACYTRVSCRFYDTQTGFVVRLTHVNLGDCKVNAASFSLTEDQYKLDINGVLKLTEQALMELLKLPAVKESTNVNV